MRRSPTARARASGRRRSAAPPRSSTTTRNIPSAATCSPTWRSSTTATAFSTTATTRRRRRRSSARRRGILKSGAFLLSLGGDHFVTWPLLKAHAALHGPLALVQFDAHQDTWDDDGKRIDHGSFVGACRARRHRRPGPLHPDRHPHPCPGRLRHPARPRPRGRGDEQPRAGRCHREAHGRPSGLSDVRHRLPRSGLRARNGDAGRRRTVHGQDPRRAAPAHAPRHTRRRRRRGGARPTTMRT